jgi:hypothetical protein
MKTQKLLAAFAFFLLLTAASGFAQTTTTPKPQTLSVTGKLVRMMAIGGETGGWSIELDSEIKIADKPVKSLEVDAPTDKLTPLENKKVSAKGTIVTNHGVERGDYPVLRITKIHKASETPTSSY